METTEQPGQIGVGLENPNVISAIRKSTYILGDFDKAIPGQEVTFYEMLPDGSSSTGTTLEEMLRVSIERLTDLNSRFSCLESSIAITKMQEALMWLNKRTEDRIARGVEGKHLA